MQMQKDFSRILILLGFATLYPTYGMIDKKRRHCQILSVKPFLGKKSNYRRLGRA